MIHDCLLAVEQVYSSRPDMHNELLENPVCELFTDGTSFVQERKQKAGYTIVTTTKVIEAKLLPVNTSAQKAELIALQQALEMMEGKESGLIQNTHSV